MLNITVNCKVADTSTRQLVASTGHCNAHWEEGVYETGQPSWLPQRCELHTEVKTMN